jgi:SPOR domain
MCGIQVKLMTMMRTLVLFFFLCLTPVWAISYTVQLFASSDEPKASQLQAELADQGYKAYLLRVPTAQGQVYRIRVGAFANRAAAALFAQALPSVEGSTPSPALVEGGESPGFIPLQPALLGQYDVVTTLVQVFPWPVAESAVPETAPQQASEDGATEGSAATAGDSSSSTQDENSSPTTSEATPEDQSGTSSGEAQPSEPTAEPSSETASSSDEATSTEEPASESAPQNSNDTAVVVQANPDTNEAQQPAQPVMAIRVQPRDASEQARYRVGSLEFEAWRATSLGDGWILRVRSFSVWPEDWQTASQAERDQYRETVLANLSGDLDLTPQQLEPFVFELQDKAPFVVLVERFNPETQQIERLRSIGQPRPNQENLGLTLEGPSAFLGEAVDIALPAADTVFEPSEESDIPDKVIGNGWQAGSDDDFVTLTVENKTWRAAVGQPLWANDNFLICFYNKQILLYQIQQP